MRTYAEVRKRFPQLPEWYTFLVHGSLVNILRNFGDYQGNKMLRDISKLEPIEQDLSLVQAKQLCEYVKSEDVVYPEDLVEQVAGIINDDIQENYSTVDLEELLSYVPKDVLLTYLENNKEEV